MKFGKNKSISEFNSPIIIIGMHRSGTTLLTRLLIENGVYFGKSLTFNNESIFFLQLNEWILQQTNSSWDNPHNYKFHDTAFENNIINICRSQMKSIFSIKYYGWKNYVKYKDISKINFLWGWKDPRNTFLINIWKKIFPNAKILHIYRNPVDVAASLQKRSKQSIIKYKPTINSYPKMLLMRGKIQFCNSYRVLELKEGFKLWKEYTTQALTIGEALHIKYEDLIDNTKQELSNILSFLNIDHNTLITDDKLKNIKRSRKNAFVNDLELLSFYQKIKNKPLVRKLDYHLIDNEIPT